MIIGINWQIKDTGGSLMNKSLCNLLILRGPGLSLQSVDTSQFTQSAMYSSLTPESDRCTVWSSDQSINDYEKSAVLLR